MQKAVRYVEASAEAMRITFVLSARSAQSKDERNNRDVCGTRTVVAPRIIPA
jgi:hypothetical protein